MGGKGKGLMQAQLKLVGAEQTTRREAEAKEGARTENTTTKQQKSRLAFKTLHQRRVGGVFICTTYLF